MATITDQSDAPARTLKHIEVKKGHSDSRLVIAQHKYQVRRAPVTAFQANNYPGEFEYVFHCLTLFYSFSFSNFPASQLILWYVQYFFNDFLSANQLSSIVYNQDSSLKQSRNLSLYPLPLLLFLLPLTAHPSSQVISSRRPSLTPQTRTPTLYILMALFSFSPLLLKVMIIHLSLYNQFSSSRILLH